MGRYVDKPLWEEEILIVDESTPIYGGYPDWDALTGRLISGYSNISAAMLADRTRWLRDEIANKPSKEEVDQLVGQTNGVQSSRNIDSEDSTIVLSDPPQQTISQFTVALNNETTQIDMGITVSSGTYRSVVLLLRQATGANQVEWDENILWSSGRPPVLSYEMDSVDVVRLVSDPSTPGQWYGFFDGAWME